MSAVRIDDNIVSFAKYGNALWRENQLKMNVFVGVLEAVFRVLSVSFAMQFLKCSSFSILFLKVLIAWVPVGKAQ